MGGRGQKFKVQRKFSRLLGTEEKSVYEGRTETASHIHSRIINRQDKQMEVDIEADGKTDPWISTDGYESI
jgi:hypothetical protein